LSLFESEFYHRTSENNLPLTALLSQCEVAAGIHAAQLGWSIESLQAKGQSWVLTRIMGEFPKQIVEGVGISLSTFPSKADRYVTCRDFILEDAQTQLLAHLRTEWLILDLKSRKPVRLPDAIHSLLFKPEPPEPLLLGWPGDISYSEQTIVTVTEVDLDLNGHVNNRRYIQWLFTGSVLAANFFPRYFDIQFKAEALLGDTLKIVTAKSDADWYAQIRNAVTDAVMVDLKATFPDGV
jgi:acyl-ACP thioesterase